MLNPTIAREAQALIDAAGLAASSLARQAAAAAIAAAQDVSLWLEREDDDYAIFLYGQAQMHLAILRDQLAQTQ